MPKFDRYATAHASPAGPGDARPTAQQIIDDEGLRGKLSDKTIFITGCSSGLGIETAKALATTGARLYLTVRNMQKGKAALQTILQGGSEVDASRIELIHMDLNSLQSVRDAAKEFQGKSQQLNILINNAGVMMPPKDTTQEGFETQFGVDHLAHFLLFQLLKPILLASSTPSFPSRVVNLASLAHRLGQVQLDDYNFEKSGYDAMRAYAQAKTCNIWMANEIERQYGKDGKLHALSVHPGGIRTGLLDHQDESVKSTMDQYLAIPELIRTFKSPEQGSATTVLAAVGAAFHDRGGIYLEDCAESFPVPEDTQPWKAGYFPWAFDEAGEKKLWADSLAFVGLANDDAAS